MSKIKTKEQLCKEQIDQQPSFIDPLSFTEGFMSALEFGNPWIDVSISFPEENELLLDNSIEDLIRTVRVLAMTETGSVIDSVRVYCIDGKWDWCPTVMDEEFIKWRLL